MCQSELYAIPARQGDPNSTNRERYHNHDADPLLELPITQRLRSGREQPRLAALRMRRDSTPRQLKAPGVSGILLAIEAESLMLPI